MDLETYAILKKKIDNVALAYSYKGGVATVDDLPDDADLGDLYTVGAVQYVWNGTEWTEVGGEAISNAQIDALFTVTE